MRDESLSAGGGNGNGSAAKVRIGVFICHCGGNISDVVDVQRVAAAIGRLPDVVLSTTHMFMCSDPAQVMVEEKIRELKLNRVIVAACSPSLHELTFRRCLARAGLNPYLFEHVNVREQVSWVVTDREAATEKATRLVAAAVGRARHLQELQKRRIPIRSSALVIGGGVAGLLAARDIARRGMDVTLLEQSPFLGGRTAQLGELFPTGDSARELLAELIADVTTDRRITIYTNAEITGSTGVIGDFQTTVRLNPRGVSRDIAHADAAIAACPESCPNAFDYELTTRKALYLPYSGCYPAYPAVDWATCTKCGKCVPAAGTGIVLDEAPREVLVQSGVIVMATGFNPYQPRAAEYGFAEFPQVVTLAQLNRLLDPDGPSEGKLSLDGRDVRSVAFIHCVGSRQWAGIHAPQADGKINDYCSRVCCTAVLQAAKEIKARFPGTHVYSFYQDIRAYGMGHEEYYTQAAEEGVLFMRYSPQDPPRVEADSSSKHGLVVKCKDLLTQNLELEAPVDLVVLATGMMPRDVSTLVDLFRCARGADRFLLEVHPKLRPVELAVSGVFLAGTVQGPMDVTESCAAAAAAASKAAALMSQGFMELDPFIAEVDSQLCSGCKSCLTVCPYDAISRDEEKGVAVVSTALCMGCGTCVAACPSGAIRQFGFADEMVISELNALLAGYAQVGA